MANEVAILSSIAFDRTAFEAVREHADEEEFSAHGRVVWREIAGWYDGDAAARQVDVKALHDRLARKHPKQAAAFSKLLRALSPDAGSKNIAREILELKRQAAGERLVVLLSQNGERDKVLPALDEYRSLVEASDLLDAGGATLFETPLDTLIAKTEDKENRYKLLPMAVNRRLRGGLLPGHCVVVFGRVNVGKSAFAINATAGFLKQGLKVLYIENEDLLEDTALRVGCRLVGCDRDWARENPKRFREIASERGYGQFMLPDPAPLAVADVDRMLAQYEPDVCVVNQARNFVREGSHNPVFEMDSIAKQFRAMGKRRRVVMLLVTAAKEGSDDHKGSSREKHILEKSDCYSSKTGFPAAADVMIGFGSNTNLEERDMACLSICKNKLGGKNAVIYVSVDFDRGIIREAQ